MKLLWGMPKRGRGERGRGGGCRRSRKGVSVEMALGRIPGRHVRQVGLIGITRSRRAGMKMHPAGMKRATHYSRPTPAPAIRKIGKGVCRRTKVSVVLVLDFFLSVAKSCHRLLTLLSTLGRSSSESPILDCFIQPLDVVAKVFQVTCHHIDCDAC